MADFQPLRAWRYHPEKTVFSEVIAPPYDIISEECQQKLYDRSPRNCVRLILNKHQPADHDRENRYTRARDCFQAWREDQTLIRDEVPSFYLYRQTFEDPVSRAAKTRVALLGRLKLETFDRGIVIAHEKTLSKPKEDRKKLLEATGTNFSPIFGLYEDSKKEILSRVEVFFKENPDYRGTDDERVLHELWVIRDPQTVQSVHAAFVSKKIYIADGHHRYQTALDHSTAVRDREKAAPGVSLPSDYVLMALVEMSDPGLVLMATHRMILPFAGFQPEQMLQTLGPFFRLEEMSAGKILGHFKEDRGRAVSMGLLLGNGRSFLATLKDIKQAMQAMEVSKPEAWCRLDVTLLNHLILAKLWHLPEKAWEGTIRYTHSSEEAVRKAGTGEFFAVFLLKDPPVNILYEMGEIGELLPQKTTYFYPKLASGLVFYEHIL
jgi:uncharacterized protein (DUF1015 family)